MGYSLNRQPFMLLETVEMLYKYVNNITFSSILSRLRVLYGNAIAASLSKRLLRLQEILEEICRDIDQNDPLLQQYFAKVDTDCACEDLCLARLLTYSFCTLREPELQANGEEIRGIWRQLQSRGAWIQQCVIAGLEFSDGPGSPGDLFAQVRALPLPAEFRLVLYDALRNFDDSLDALLGLAAPYAQRLEAYYREERWLLEETADYWAEHFQKMPPLKFLSISVGENAVYGAGESTVVAVALMNCDVMIYDMAGVSPICPDYNLLYMGCGVTTVSTVRRRGADLEGIGAIMKTLSDKKRLEILCRLSRERSYCHELADVMGVDPGNLSRSLAVLYHYGFLRQERESLKNYYRTDREALHNFLQLVETVLLSGTN